MSTIKTYCIRGLAKTEVISDNVLKLFLVNKYKVKYIFIANLVNVGLVVRTLELNVHKLLYLVHVFYMQILEGHISND